MEWDRYLQRYNVFVYSIQSLIFTSTATYWLFKDFPVHFPESWHQKLRLARESVHRRLQDHKSDGHMDISELLDEVAETVDIVNGEAPGLVESWLHAWISAFMLGRDPDSPQFEDMTLVQQWIMALAHLDAFVSETVHIVLDRCLAGDEVKENLVFENKRSRNVWMELQWLRDHLDLQSEINDLMLIDLEAAWYVRNAFVHAGGIVDPRLQSKVKQLQEKPYEHIELSPRQQKELEPFLAMSEGEFRLHGIPLPAKCGERLELDYKGVYEMTDQALRVGAMLFCGTAKKCYDRNCQDLTSVLLPRGFGQSDASPNPPAGGI